MSRRIYWTMADAEKLGEALQQIFDEQDKLNDRLLALERGGETKPKCPGCGQEMIWVMDNGFCGCKKPGQAKPAPATVETAPTMSEKAATLFEQFSRMCEKADGIEMEVWFAHRDSVRVAIDQLQAENERLRGLCGETHQHLKNILTTPGTNITGSCYVCHDLLVRLDRASKETI